jgi:hypothetical protein
LFLPGKCFFGTLVSLNVHEAVNAMGLHKRRTFAVTVLFQPLLQRIGYPDVEGAVAATGEDVDLVHA